MKDKEELEVLVLNIGNEYLKAPIRLRITVGQVIEGKRILNYGKQKR